ncbi:MAG TPA: POTRA domain-containing protein, partial [Lysobacter sp.]|nr:POTRA domain-containing protein [Lysobacter sp.]
MRPVPRPVFHCLCFAALLLSAVAPARAAVVQEVHVRGLDPVMTENVRQSLSLVDAIGRDVSGRRMAYLVREAEAETREALEPFGYYAPNIKVERTRASDAPVVVTVNVALGSPVRVRAFDVGIDGEGAGDRYLKEEIDAFHPTRGEVLDHAIYEASKARITRRLAERGYFDADFTARKVEVTRAEAAADVALHWNSGVRYDMGAIDFQQSPKQIVRDSLLQKLVYWKPGEYYHQGRLDRLRKSLTELDYFGRIEIEPQPEHAVGEQVPVTVTLTPAKRDVYTAGVSYGTDSGAGVRLGLERRYVNDRGHKFLAQIDYAQYVKTGTLQYRVPAFRWLDGWYTASLQGADEHTD